MSPIYAAFLGVIQGLSEFIPVSSTAHLTLAGRFLGLIDLSNPRAWTQFIAVMQLGTLAAVLVFFRKDLAGMAAGLLSDLRTKGFRIGSYKPQSLLALYIGLGTIPVAVFGFAFKQVIEGVLTKTTPVIVVDLVVFAGFLWLAEVVSSPTRRLQQVTWKDALLIGCSQVLSLIPGSSRSGTTIATGLLVGLERSAAARFSFLLSMPAVLASGIFEMLRIDETVFTLGTGNLIIATVMSGLAGYAAIAWLLRFLMKHSTIVFVWYRFGVGFAVAVLLIAQAVTGTDWAVRMLSPSN